MFGAWLGGSWELGNTGVEKTEGVLMSSIILLIKLYTVTGAESLRLADLSLLLFQLVLDKFNLRKIFR